MNSINICHIPSFDTNDVIKDLAVATRTQNVAENNSLQLKIALNFYEWQHWNINIL